MCESRFLILRYRIANGYHMKSSVCRPTRSFWFCNRLYNHSPRSTRAREFELSSVQPQDPTEVKEKLPFTVCVASFDFCDKSAVLVLDSTILNQVPLVKFFKILAHA